MSFEAIANVGRRAALERLWASAPGWRGALTAVNHSVVGKRFMLTALCFFLIGGVLAMLIRAQLATPESAFLTPGAYAQVFTMHGVIMMFLFAIPLIEGFTLYILPKILGARDLAFPILSAFGYWCYGFGGLILLAALAIGAAPDSGWFMYAPLSSKPYAPGINSDIYLIGVTFVEVSAVCFAVEVMTTVLKVRADGMALNRMPILAWYLWVTSAMMLFGFPPLILGSVLLELERAFGLPFFDPERGGHPLLWQHLFWLFGHPEVYIIFLPAAGIVSTLIPVFARTALVGYTWIVLSLIALAFISFGIWAHHMFTTGIPDLSLGFFSAASMMVVIPTAVQIFAWLATLLRGRPRLDPPMLYIYGFLFIFVLGGLTGVMVAVIPFDWQVHDTHFVVAHLHYVLVGGFVFPVLAGLYYWLPHLSGRRPPRGMTSTGFALLFLGFNLTFLPMHLTGLLGMPRRVHAYSEGLGWAPLNLASSVGGFILSLGFGLVLIELLLSLRYGRRAQGNVWAATTLDWAMPIPPPSYNFAALPTVRDRDPLLTEPELAGRLSSGAGLFAEPRNGWRETLGVQALSGRAEQVLLLPGPTWIPLFTALAAALFFVSFLFGLYAFSILGLVAIAICAWAWAWRRDLRGVPAQAEMGEGRLATLHPAAPAPPSLWGMTFLLMANGVLFGSLVFGFLFLFVVAPNWPPPAAPRLDLPAIVIAAVAALASAATAWRARASRPGSRWLLASCAACVLLALAAAWLAFAAVPDPRLHAHAAASFVLLGYAGAMALIGAIIAAYAWRRAAAGYVWEGRAVEPKALLQWQAYTALTALIALALVFGMVPQAGL